VAESEQDHLVNHLRDVHALEQQSIRQLERSQEMSQADEMKELYAEHLEQTREHERLIAERIHARDLKPSAVKDLTMRAGAIGLRQLAEIPPDTPVKLAMHYYALEHLEIATYEALIHIARREDDNETVEVAERILGEEKEAAEKIAETFEKAVELMYERGTEPPEGEPDRSQEAEAERSEGSEADRSERETDSEGDRSESESDRGEDAEDREPARSN
jgi:ferritin-like metal-binding protein YciE